MGFDITSLLSGFDEDQAAELLDSLDDDQVNRIITRVMVDYVGPHLVDIRERAQRYESRHEVRNHYEAMDDMEQDQQFHRAVAELRASAEMLRTNPVRGIQDMKNKLRNPIYHEALLMAFDGEQVPDEWSRERKEFATMMGRWALMSLIPEAYTRAEAEELIREVYGDDADIENYLDGGDLSPGGAP